MTGNEKYEIFNGLVKLSSAIIIGFYAGPRYFWGIAFSITVSEILVNGIRN